MLVYHVFPAFRSPMGHLRAKAAWVAGCYANMDFVDPDNFQTAFHHVVIGMCDSEFPVSVASVFALGSFLRAFKDVDLDAIWPILSRILDELMKMLENGHVITPETIVDKLGEKVVVPFALGLCENLVKAFWTFSKFSETVQAAVKCLRALSTILKSISSHSELFVQIEPILLPIMRNMAMYRKDVFEQILEIVSHMTFFSPTISLDMWSLWPFIVESSLALWGIGFFPNVLVPLDDYISRSTTHFLKCENHQQSLFYMISSVMRDQDLEDGDINPAPKLIQVVFRNCRGQIDHWFEFYILLTIERLLRTEKPRLNWLLIEVIADAFCYNAYLTLAILLKLGVPTHFFTICFQMLKHKKKSGILSNFKREHDKKVYCLGLTTLLPPPANQLPLEDLEQNFEAALACMEQLEEAEKDEDAGDMVGMPTDDEDDDDTSDEVDGAKLRELAAQAKAFCSADDEDEDYSDDDFVDTVKGGVFPYEERRQLFLQSSV